MTSPLPPLRRIVTGHSDTGQAIVKYDDRVTAKIVPHGAALRSFSIFRIVDFPPRSSGHMHRTISIDYVVVQKGAVVLVLEDGSKTPVGEGDVVVQQGTMHGWDNPTDEWARLLVILLPAEAPVVAGKALKTDVSSLGV
ncbi:hypothetical protein ACKRZS_008749 [Fusarium odoratissimum]